MNRKEYKHLYYLNHRDEYAFRNKKNRILHHKELLKYSKDYYNSNRSALIKRKAEYNKRTSLSMVKKIREWRRNHPEAYKAQTAVTNALANGKLKRPNHCQFPRCRIKKIEAHYHAGYSEENRLNVIWLCRKHHLLADGRTIKPEVKVDSSVV